MPYPSTKEVELPLLKEIADAGGTVRIRDRRIYAHVARYFPQLTDEELIRRKRASDTVWENRVQWVRLRLVRKGELMDWRPAGGQGIWKITAKGLRRLDTGRPTLELLEKRAAGSQQPEQVSAPEDVQGESRTHSRVQEQLKEIGRILGKFAKQEYRQDMYRFDVVWKDAEYLPRATHCFEVQHKGNLVEALAKLKHAFDIWGARLVLVITDERDGSRARQLLTPYFSGVFHEIGSVTTVLTADEVNDLYRSLSRHRDTMGVFVGR